MNTFECVASTIFTRRFILYLYIESPYPKQPTRPNTTRPNLQQLKALTQKKPPQAPKITINKEIYKDKA